MTPRAEMTAALGAVGVGGLVALVAAGQPRTTGDGPARDAGTPGAAALSLVLLAGAAVVLLVRARVRRVVGILLVAASVGIVAAYLSRGSGWAWPGVVGGTLSATGSAVMVIRAGRWPRPGRAFEEAGPRRSTDPWEALDRGEDPTT